MARQSDWITEGFEAFRRGSFGNAGHNLYVSRAGVLQRIHLYDFNRDGFVDLVFCNSQEQWEAPPAYVYSDVFGRRHRMEVPSDGSPTGAAADLSGDGYDDLVLGNEFNGVNRDLNSFIYFGSAQGLTERHRVELPTPGCSSVAAGDFNGDGRKDVAAVCRGGLRLFLQTTLGFEPRRFADLAVSVSQVAAADLDGDGFCDLVALRRDGPPVVFWGGRDGLNPWRCSEFPVAGRGAAAESAAVSEEEKVSALAPLACVVRLRGVAYVFAPLADHCLLVPARPDRSFGPALRFACARAFAVAAGDLRGIGACDLVFAARDRSGGAERSWVYWGGPEGYAEDHRSPLATSWACDVAVGDLDGDGRDDVVICQHRTDANYSFHSLAFRGSAEGLDPEPVRLPTEGARRVFVARASDDPRPQVIFVNRFSRGALGDLRPTVFYGGPDGFSPDRGRELRGIGSANALGCDLNDDGFPDVVIANSAENAVNMDPGSYVFLGGPDGLPSEPTWIIPTKKAWGVATADLNRDGWLDLVMCCYGTAEVFVFYGGPNGLDLARPQRIPTVDEGVPFDEPRRLCLADFNGDGWLDLVVSQAEADRCFLFWGGPDGFSADHRRMLPVMRGSAPTACDLTGSGRLDLIIGGHKPSLEGPHDSFVYIYWNGPEGLREDRRTQLPANAVLALAIADFNRDGWFDLFAGSYTTGRDRDIDSHVYWGGPHGFRRGDRTRLRTHSVSGCLAADFNEDGWIDLAICNHKTFGDHRGDSFVLWNGPGGLDPSRCTRLPTTGSHGMIFFQPGNQADRGPEEHYVSEPFEMPPGARPRSIEWTAGLPPKTWVRAHLRSAATREGLAAAPWFGPQGPCPVRRQGPSALGLGQMPRERDAFENRGSLSAVDLAGPWIQYRLALGAVNGGCTPRVTRVRVVFG